jgi:hypothetical protein
MPTYYFNVRDGVPVIQDRVGMNLPDLAAAIEHARKEAVLVVSGPRSQPDLLKDLKIQVCDENGNMLESVDLPDLREFAK